MSQSTLKTALKAIFDEQKTKTNQQDSIDEISDDMATAITDEISDIGFLNDRGNWDASGNVFPSTGGSGALGAIEKGDIWTISVEGTLGGTTVYVGNTIRALQDLPLQVSGNWAIGETTSDHAGLDNLDYENSGHTGFQPSDTTALTADTPLDADYFDFWDVVDSSRKKITKTNLLSLLNRNIDGGRFDSVYTSEQLIDGGSL